MKILKQSRALLTLLILICPIAKAADVKLSWTANTESDLAGYKLYQGTASRTYGSPTQIGIQTTYTVIGLAPGTYYFALKAFDTSGNESGFSNEVSKVIITPPPEGESPSGTVIPPASQITDATTAV